MPPRRSGTTPFGVGSSECVSTCLCRSVCCVQRSSCMFYLEVEFLPGILERLACCPCACVCGLPSVYGDDAVCRCACCLLVYSSFTIFAWMTARTRGTRVPCSFILLESCMTLHAAHTNSPSKCALTAALRSCIRYNIPTKCYFSSHDPCLSLRLLLPFVRLAEASQSTFAAGIFSTIPSCRAAFPLPT